MAKSDNWSDDEDDLIVEDDSETSDDSYSDGEAEVDHGVENASVQENLPSVGDARTSTCIPYPDHRCSRFETYLTKALISQVPVVPRGQGFLLSYKRGRLGEPQVDSFNRNNKHKSREGSRSWVRVNPVAAYVDFYRPKYAVLENVVAMADQSKGSKKKNVFAQVICSLVGMGYQVQRITRPRTRTSHPVLSNGTMQGFDPSAPTCVVFSMVCWYAYVQEVKTNSRGQSFLKVIVLYAPSDTTCSAMHYPIKNELFFPDHCNCGDDAIPPDDVACKVTVDFLGNPGDSIAGYIVRQKYKTGAATFVTLKMEDFRCVCSGPPKSTMEVFKDEYHVGDTVLIRMRIGPKEDGLEPGTSAEAVLVRCLPRRSRNFPDQKGIRPNELVYGDKMVTIPIEKVTRKCMVRFYTEDDRLQKKILAPYDRDGTADAFYITSRQVKGSPVPALEPLTQPFPTELIQGFDPSAPPRVGYLMAWIFIVVEGTSAVGLKKVWAVDFDQDAIHTYKANLKDTEGTSLYFGSVNDLLAQAMKGRYNKYVPAPGEVDFISAGSPCQGFSNANQQKLNEKSLRNSSGSPQS
ncbi:MAG: DNA methyltransferase Dim-2 [Peltula sp. TS41687]|nr:MAG: DNA methyltransferase Dim-2 [Peltula sp. TS41687]